MEFCKYFVSGKCKYRSKCHNSHIDVQYAVQEEMKSALHGNQWPLSSFSPFFDKPSLPGFLEDYSFEEVRWDFEMAKMENRVPQFQKDFKRTTTHAFEKMKKFTTPDAGVKNYLVDIYGVTGVKEKKKRNVKTFGDQPSFGTSAAPQKSIWASGDQTIFDRMVTTTVAKRFDQMHLSSDNPTDSS